MVIELVSFLLRVTIELVYPIADTLRFIVWGSEKSSENFPWLLQDAPEFKSTTQIDAKGMGELFSLLITIPFSS